MHLRRLYHCSDQLTYATVQRDPSAYVGRVVELRGKVGGTASVGSGMSMMLTMSDNAVTLEVPASEVPVLREDDNPVVRVLVRVGPGGSGNVVPLSVVAMAHETEVSYVERQQSAQREALRRSREQAEYARMRSRVASSPSRGSYYRPQLTTPDVQAQVAYYQPHLGVRARPLMAAYLSYILQVNSRLSVPMAAQITYGLLSYADYYSVDPRLVVAMIIAESDFNPNSTSRTGAMGLGQLMPGTARSLGVANPYDPVQNLGGSIAYLREHLDSFASAASYGGGYSFEQVALAMAAYNAGPNSVRKYRGVPPYRETQAYVNRVISLYRRLSGQ
jgi:soluble lytic murein transglycosylase-like protein